MNSGDAFFHHVWHQDHAIHQETDSSRATIHYPVFIKPEKIEALVFSGGGVSGILHYATLELLQDYHVLSDSSTHGILAGTHIRCVVGTSAGALTALLVCLGCTMSQLYEQMTKVFPVQDNLDISLHRILSAVQHGNDSQLALLNPVRLHNILYKVVETCLPQWGTFLEQTTWGELSTVDVFPATPYEHLPHLDCFCRSVGGCLTFSLFHHLTGMDLRVIVTDVDSCHAFECSAESTPDVCIFQATMASMSIPLLLPPFFLMSRQWGRRYRECHDGGFVCNYPMWFATRTYPPSHIIGSCIGSTIDNPQLVSRSSSSSFSHSAAAAAAAAVEVSSLTGIVSNSGENATMTNLSSSCSLYNAAMSSSTSTRENAGANSVETTTTTTMTTTTTTRPTTDETMNYSQWSHDIVHNSTTCGSYNRWRDYLNAPPLMEGVERLVSMRSHLGDVFQSTYKKLFALMRTQMQFSTWKFIPEEWKRRTIFPPKQNASSLHFLSVKATCGDLAREIAFSKQQMIQQNAVRVRKTKRKSEKNTPLR